MKYNKANSIYILLFLLISTGSCAQNKENNLIVGEFRITKVIDGDTFRFEGLDNSTRLLGIDTEETFKSNDAEQKSNEIALNWENYYLNEKGESRFPVKSDSPFGFETKKWTEEFFKDINTARLEIEDTSRTIDIYGRYLVYLFAVKDGKEINYNVECVRQGYSPYFNKYGNSKRFHKEFTDAQEYARINNLGIWDPAGKHYPDYEERIQWWNKRAGQIERYGTEFSGNENYFNLSEDYDFSRLENFIGKEITVFGSISDVLTKKFPYILRIPHDKEKVFEIIVFEENQDILKELDLEELKNYYVYISGTLEKYKDRYQINLKDKSQIRME
ncbi:MAG: hypothetical protein HGGPFJEG_01134 [Ignavibacteria bacterium]|nr:hypothetical protein [Ignavibacteria bacterium]